MHSNQPDDTVHARRFTPQRDDTSRTHNRDPRRPRPRQSWQHRHATQSPTRDRHPNRESTCPRHAVQWLCVTSASAQYGKNCRYTSPPPITHATGSSATAASASSTLCTTSTPSAAKLSSRVSTILRRFLSGRPPGKLSSVLRPIMTGQPLVHATKWRMSARLDTTMSPSHPMPQSSHTATMAESLHVMSATYTAMGMFLTCGPCS